MRLNNKRREKHRRQMEYRVKSIAYKAVLEAPLAFCHLIMEINLSFIMLMLLCFQLHTKAQEDPFPSYKEIPVGVILDMGSWVGKTVHSYITMALCDFYTVNPHFQTRIVLHNRDTHGEPLHAMSAALDLLEKPKVQAIIGSESTAEAKLLAVLGDRARVPILSLSPCLSCNKHPYFLQVTQDETTQFKGIAAMAESFGWKDVIVICEDSDSGRDMTTFIINTFQMKSILVTHMSFILASSNNELLQKELHKLSTMQTKRFIMHASPSLASHIFLNAKSLGMMKYGYKWIITGKTMDFFNIMEDEVIESMQGAVGFKSYDPQSRGIHNFPSRWIKEYSTKNPVMKLKEIDSYAIWAYDTVSALAMAVERIQLIQADELEIKHLETRGLTQRGTTLLNKMLNISFHGSDDAFQLTINVASQVLEIVNVIGKEGERRVGFWTTDAAFTKKIGRLDSFSDDGLETIIWPGGITTNSTHRMMQQVSSKTLRIGVPLQIGSGKVFHVNYDDQNKSIFVSGFCADVFQIAFTALGRDVAYQFIPFTEKDGNLNYNDLIYRVYTGEFDGVIGDITITANRSLYVDFTQPYTDLGLGMLSRNADASMWIFMEPLSSDLWLVFACFFILLGFVIWILENPTNEEFQGSTTQQMGTTLWFAFSTLVFAHRQKLQSNLSRFVVTVWLFVVLVLASSYTATLSSLYTIEQIRLASKGASIGYRGSSFVGNYIKNYNFRDTRLRPYATLEDYAHALSCRSKNCGVDAIVDEIPYLKEFLAWHPSGYSMAVYEKTTSGFGFAFSRGSPLVPELSRQISRLREDGTLEKLENKWFNSDPRSKDSQPVSKNLNLKDCRGLFLLSGVSMVVALFIFLLYFIYEKVNFTYTMLAGGKLAFIMRILKPTTAG